VSSYNYIKYILHNGDKMKNRSTQDLILNAFDDAKLMSAHDLAIECAVSEAAVRYHLRNLSNLGLIMKFEDSEPDLKAGRKADRFRKTQPDSRLNTNHLCSVLLNLLLATSEKDASNIVETIARNMLADQVTAKPYSLRNMIEWLNKHHYSASWEAGRFGPVIQLSICPYREIQEADNLLCNLDTQILRILSGHPWELLNSMKKETQNGNCKFVVKPVACR
jgi:predicted ArsR family transcriptional regulator